MHRNRLVGFWVMLSVNIHYKGFRRKFSFVFGYLGLFICELCNTAYFACFWPHVGPVLSFLSTLLSGFATFLEIWTLSAHGRRFLPILVGIPCPLGAEGMAPIAHQIRCATLLASSRRCAVMMPCGVSAANPLSVRARQRGMFYLAWSFCGHGNPFVALFCFSKPSQPFSGRLC